MRPRGPLPAIAARSSPWLRAMRRASGVARGLDESPEETGAISEETAWSFGV
jgi:hypothetical protein